MAVELQYFSWMKAVPLTFVMTDDGHGRKPAQMCAGSAAAGNDDPGSAPETEGRCALPVWVAATAVGAKATGRKNLGGREWRG
jgi:hypothetical protein